MSKDIRSFFTVTQKGLSSPVTNVKPKKRAVVKLSSDEEIFGTPNNQKKEKKPKLAKKSRKTHVISSSDDEDAPKQPSTSRKFNLNKLKPTTDLPRKIIDPKDIFGNDPVKRIERPKMKSKTMTIESDDELEQSLMEAYNEATLVIKTPEKKSPKKTTPKRTPKIKTTISPKKTPDKIKSPQQNGTPKTPFPKLWDKNMENTPERRKSPRKTSKYPPLHQLDSDEEKEKSILDSYKNTPEKQNTPKKIIENGIKLNQKKFSSPSIEKKIKSPNRKINLTDSPSRTTRSNNNTPEKKPVIKSQNNERKVKKTVEKLDDHNNSDIDPDQERFEKKRMAAILYQKFKNRSGVLNPGCKEIPEGKPNCLVKFNFVITGVLESLERHEAAELIKKYGGKVTTALSKKTNYMVIGEDAGLAKIAKADDLGVKQITEDELLLLISSSIKQEKKIDSSQSTPKRKLDTDNKESEQAIKKRKISPVKVKNETPVKVKKESPVKNKKETPVKIKKESPTENTTPVKIKIEKSPMKIKKEEKSNGINNDIKSDFNLDKVKLESKMPKGDLNNLPWVEKYKPTCVNDIIGQQGNTSNCVKLTNWLKKWYTNHDGKKKLGKPNPWAKNDDGSYFKAALLSGPPGIGKTTTASLVCQELGFDVVEFNASDTRSKKLLKEEVSELLSNKSLFGYFHGQKEGVSKRHVLLMDEVDGMAGNEDRGGMQELIGLIKESSIPIICMCNDRNHQKMRSLVNYCYDLRFNKPRIEQIRGPIMSVLFKENFKISAPVLNEIIAATNNDIRQTLNYLSMLSVKKDLECVDGANSTKKDLKLGPWDVVRKVFSADEHKNMSLYDKCDLFFHDYSMGPLFVQQNYLSVAPNVPKNEILDRVSMAADSLSLGDLVDKRIRSNMAWSLLPVQGMFSSVMVGEYMEGRITAQINFPGWLGKNSRYNKRKRLAQEVHDHTRICTSASVSSFRLDYAPILIAAIVKPLKEKGLDGVQEALEIIKEYRLLREDIDSLIELTSWPGKKNPMDGVDSKVKAALTRAYNKEVTPYVYTAMAAVKKKKSEAINDNEEYDDNEGDESQAKIPNSSDDEDDNNLDNDALIKAKKVPSKSSSASTSKTKNTKDGPKPKSKKGK